ncbi:OmpH family outer membrane protein [Bacteroidia bacterium]|jgi:outer membrane protein|nr:OmpH family outer membrane protein [Bacteroidia bacterium]
MKKVLVILTMVCAAFAVQAQTKVGHINSSLLIESMPEADSIQKKLAVEQEQWKNIVDDKDREMRTKYAAFMEISEDPSINKTVKEIKMQEVENLQKQFQELQQRANVELQRKQEELLKPLLEKVRTAISEVAKANGYAYVMETSEGSGVIYSDPKFDLLPLVKAKLSL